MGSSLRCCNLGSCIGTPGKSLPHFWEENQAWFVGCLSGGPCVFCVVLLSVPLSVSHQCLCPLSPCSSSNTQSLSCLLPAPSDPPKGQLLRPCLAVPAPSSPMAQGLCPAHSTLGAPPPPRLSPAPLPWLWALGSGHSFTTFLLSCPSPRAPACSGREASRTLFPLFKVSRLVSQEGGLPHHSSPTSPQPDAPPQPRGPGMGEGAIPGGSRPLPGEGATET